MLEGWFLLASPLLAGAGLLASLYGVVCWRGVWRVLAALPWVALVAYVSFVLVPDAIADPSSHNLLPFEIGILFSPSLLWIGVLAGIRRAREELRNDPSSR